MEEYNFSITTFGFVFPSAFTFTLFLERETLYSVRIHEILLLVLITPLGLNERRPESGGALHCSKKFSFYKE